MANDPVLEALERQVDCYRRLAKLAAVQHEHVKNSRTEDLLSVLTQRQELLDQAADLEQCVSPAKKNWGGYLARLTPPDRARAESMMTQARQLLADITASDRNDTMVLQQRKLNLGRQINGATAARRVNARYAAAAYGKRPAALDLQY
ncbi:MAG: flagellar export chaperone FlgN [Tepidisphaeraceae bacterium]|jgi:hypothetical protein